MHASRFAPLLPADLLLALINAAFAVLWLPHVASSWVPRWFVATHLVGALVLPLLLERARQPLAPAVATLRDLYPLLAVAVMWGELGVRWAWTRNDANDALISSVDQSLLGLSLHEQFMATFPQLGLLMHGAYLAYYGLLIGVPLLLIARSEAARRDLALRVAASYLLCFLIAAAFPVRGPFDGAHVAVTAAGADGGLFRPFILGIRAAGDSLGTAFPSTHTAGGVTFAVLLWRHFGGTWRPIAAVLAVLIALSTVYTRNHFVLDMVAGTTVAVAAQFWLVPRLESIFRAAPRADALSA